MAEHAHNRTTYGHTAGTLYVFWWHGWACKQQHHLLPGGQETTCLLMLVNCDSLLMVDPLLMGAKSVILFHPKTHTLTLLNCLKIWIILQSQMIFRSRCQYLLAARLVSMYLPRQQEFHTRVMAAKMQMQKWILVCYVCIHLSYMQDDLGPKPICAIRYTIYCYI